jgi:diguanylate cyclase (GGDEF)-like protein
MAHPGNANKVVNLHAERHPILSQPQGGGRPTSKAIRALAVLQRLLTSLDLETIIKDFFSALSVEIPMDGVRYDYPELGLSFSYGRQTLQSCTYTLNVEDQELGTLVFRRRARFTECELERLEELLCTLIFPLRNAIRYQQALSLAHHDALTNLPNRKALEFQVKREMGLASRYGTPLSFMVVDIDHFKAINDRFGHLTGDRTLQQIARILTDNVRSTELVFRYGGDEFVILLSNTSIEGARVAADRIRQQLDKADFDALGKDSVRPTASIGISQMRQNDDAISLFQRTDEAMYDAKASGRNRVCVA